MLNSPLGGRRGIGFGLGRSWQRGGAFSPTDIAGLKLWLDFSDASTLYTDAGSTLVSSDGDAIYQANDKSGNGYHGVQTSSVSRPVYKVSQQNSLSVSKYTNDRLIFSDTLRGLLTTKVTVFAVCKHSSAGQDGFGTRYYTANEFISFYRHDDDQYRFNFARSVLDESAGTSNSTDFFIKAFRWDSANSAVTLYSDGASVGAGNPSLNQSLAGNASYTLTLGTINSAIEHYFGELIVYTEVLTDSDIASLHLYLNTKWAIY